MCPVDFVVVTPGDKSVGKVFDFLDDEIEEIDDGIKITITTDDSELIDEILDGLAPGIN